MPTTRPSRFPTPIYPLDLADVTVVLGDGFRRLAGFGLSGAGVDEGVVDLAVHRAHGADSSPLRATGPLKSCKMPVERFRSECGQGDPESNRCVGRRVARRRSFVCHMSLWSQIMRTTKTDPIIAEVRAVRDEHAARFDYDIDAIFRWSRICPVSRASRLFRIGRNGQSVVHGGSQLPLSEHLAGHGDDERDSVATRSKPPRPTPGRAASHAATSVRAPCRDQRSPRSSCTTQLPSRPQAGRRTTSD